MYNFYSFDKVIFLNGHIFVFCFLFLDIHLIEQCLRPLHLNPSGVLTPLCKVFDGSDAKWLLRLDN